MRATFLPDPELRQFAANHEIVQIHPETGRKRLYANGGHTMRFKGYERGGELAPLANLFPH